MPARIGPASEREKKANRRSPVLRTTDGENRCCADFCEARRRRNETRHTAASQREQSGPALAPARHGSKEVRSRSIAPVRARPRLPAAAVGRNQALAKSAGRFGASILRRGTAAPPHPRHEPRGFVRLAVASHVPHDVAAPIEPAPAFGNSPARSPAPACFVTTHKKRGTPTFPLRARDVSITGADSPDEGKA
ncbi:hypothetical protein AWB80_06484 [Caballeronia pedi]|uniref:Uncharacterized protein n=1 Tax=Caballeronia pedi TaxID=1777141 RepID=A0A158D8U0_9BURK|nr:hypothetical protein AWB80_06484 [Caballeronia pedi]